MVKLKSEPVSSPDAPPMREMRRTIKRSRRGREQRSLSPIEPASAGSTPRGEAGPSVPSKFRRVHPKHARNIAEAQRKRSHSEADCDDSADEAGEAGTSDEPNEPPRRRPRTQSGLHKGNTESYVKTVAKYSPAVAIPRTTSSKRKDGTEKRSLHRFSNEEHRFIWFYRNDLGCSRGDTYVHFNEYFGLHIRKDSIANTYERLRQKRLSEICDFKHTEPWAVGENYDESTAEPIVIPSMEDIEHDTEEGPEPEIDIDCTDEDMRTEILVSRERKSAPSGRTKSKRQSTSQTKPARNKTQSTGRTISRAGGERSIKKSNSKSRKHHTDILTSDSPPRKPKAKRRSSYHVNEKGSPISNPQASSSQIRRAAKKRKVEFDIDSDSSEHDREVSRKRRKSREYR